MDQQLHTQAMLLLTCNFTSDANALKALTVAEWKRFAQWLNQQGKRPEDCLTEGATQWLEKWQDPKKSQNPITFSRLVGLLSRGNALALAMERWQRAGIWVITRSKFEQRYPYRLRKLLEQDAPPILFGCGNITLLNAEQWRLAVVGSRKASSENLVYSYQLGKRTAQEQAILVSGGAQGIDESAMLGAIENGGQIIGIIANDLLRISTSVRWRQSLLEGRAVFISPFSPDAPFNKFNAMARNDYIYCLSDKAIVVEAEIKGGTFSGAEKNLKKQWIPVWIQSYEAAGNQALIELGGYLLNTAITDLSIADLQIPQKTVPLDSQIDLFSEASEPAIITDILASNEQIPLVNGIDTKEIKELQPSLAMQLYQSFIHHLQQHSSHFGLKQMVKETGLHQSQIKQWLAQAEQEGILLKESNKYIVISPNKEKLC